MGNSVTSRVASIEAPAADVDYGDVFKNAPDGILVADDEARYVAANPAACQLFGVSLQDLLGKRITDFVAPEDARAIHEQWDRFRAERSQSGRFPLRRADGQRRTLEYSAVSNIARGLHVSILRDVTEYSGEPVRWGTNATKPARHGYWEAALKSALRWEVRTTIGRYGTTVALIAAATVLQWLAWPLLKPLAYLLYFPALTLATLYGVPWLAIVLSMVVAHFVFVHQPMHRFETNWRDLFRMTVFAANALLISAVNRGLRDSQRRAAEALRQQELAFGKAERTIASLAKAEAALKASEHRLREQSTEREQFVVALSHDLRTPLTAVKLAAAMAGRQPTDAEGVRVNTQRIVRNIESADQLIRDLLDATLVGAGQKLPIQLSECELVALTTSAVAELAAVHGDRFVLNAPVALRGTWDCKAVRRVVENLVGNAVKYGEPGTKIEVRLVATDRFAELSVTNQGDALAPDEVQRIFRPYHRGAGALRGVHRGWGIGLTLVKGVVEAHGGSVSVESSVENGTTFTVRLPL